MSESEMKDRTPADPDNFNIFYTGPRLVAGYFVSGLLAVLAMRLGATQQVGMALMLCGIAATTFLVPWNPPAGWQGRQLNPEVRGYIERNRPWLSPATGLAIMRGANALATQIDPQVSVEMLLLSPAWYTAAITVGAFLTGFYARITETVSARVVEVIGFGLGVVMSCAILFG